jgi:NAD(P)-dependent dehydrogenase (short-subunit alcohol dehydrogenase family)
VVPTDSATFYAAAAYEPWVERVAAHTPCGRLATPDEVGAAIALLAQDAAQWITGEVIHVDGGARLWPDGFEP